MPKETFHYDKNSLEFVADDGSWRLRHGLKEGVFEFGECKYSFSIDVFQKADDTIWIWFSPVTIRKLSGSKCPNKEMISDLVVKVLMVSFNGNVELDTAPVVHCGSNEAK